MRNNKKLLRTISILSVLMLLSLSLAGCGKKPTDNEVILNELGEEEFTQTEYETIAANVTKQETVYVNLAPDGQVQKVQVTDWLHTDTPQTRILDTSNLADIRNVKTLTPPKIEDNMLCWDMDTTDLYYSGITPVAPPIQIGIKYFLDEQEISYKDLAGKSGSVRIEITASNTLQRKIQQNGKEYTICCPMLLVGGTIIPEEKFSNIAIDNGTSIGDGTKQIVFFAGVPGIEQSLGLSALNISILNSGLLRDKYVITADVQDFSLGNLMFAALPFSSIGTIGNGGLPETVADVNDVLSDVQLLQSAFKGLDLDRIVSLLYGDSDKLTNMLSAIKDAIAVYNENEKLIKTIGSYKTDDNIAKLDKLITDLNNTDTEALARTLSDPTVKQLLNYLPQLSSSLAGVSVLSSDLNDVMPILQGLSADMEDPEIKKSLENLPQTLEKLKKILAAVEQNKDLIDALGNLASGDNAKQIEEIMKTADKYISTGDLTEEQAQSLAGRTREWLSFGLSYDIFTAKTPTERSNVVFTFKTESIKAPKK